MAAQADELVVGLSAGIWHLLLGSVLAFILPRTQSTSSPVERVTDSDEERL